MSAPSVTLMPTASPANTTRSQRPREEVSANAAKAKKTMPTVIACDATPQHAAEKKLEPKVAASPPKRHAAGARPDCRKKHQAPRPKSSNPTGAYSFANPTGPKRNSRP